MTAIPSFTMNNGRTIPALGYGVFLMTSDQVREHLPQALELGYRHIDTANAYFNEVAVGEVVRDAIAAGELAREDLFITTKLFPQSYPYAQAVEDIDATLARLGLDYVDLLLFHQPYGEYVSGWKAMEEAVAAGKVRSIGLSNFYGRQVEEIVRTAEILPVVDQVETHVLVPAAPPGPPPGFSRHQDRGLEPAGGRGRLLTHPVLARIAQDHEATPAQVPLAFQVRTGVITIPKRRFTASACSPSTPPTTANPAGARGTRPPPTSSSRTSTPAPTT